MWTRKQRPERPEAGYSVAEVAMVMAIVGVLAGIAIPSFLTYYQASRLRVAAEEVAAFVNQARHIGIRENVGVCVLINPTTLQYRLGTCAGTAWVGAGSDAAGHINMPQGVRLAANANPVFNYLGAAVPAAAITVTNSQDGRTLKVTVAASGRVSIGP